MKNKQSKTKDDQHTACRELGALIAKELFAKMAEPRINLREIAKEFNSKKS